MTYRDSLARAGLLCDDDREKQSAMGARAWHEPARNLKRAPYAKATAGADTPTAGKRAARAIGAPGAMTATGIQNSTEAVDLLRALARSLADSGNLTDSARGSIVDDACAMGIDPPTARAIVDGAREAAARAARGRLASRAAGAAEDAARLPELLPDDDGLVEALRLAVWELRWNQTARQPEARREGADEWRRCAGDVLDDMMHACSKVATVRRGAMPEPWGIRGARQERRIVGVTARRRAESGEPDAVYQAVYIWARAQINRRMTLGAVLSESGVLHRYESHARAPLAVQEAAKAALTAAGWTFRTARRPDKAPARLWCSPAEPLPAPRRVRVR